MIATKQMDIRANIKEYFDKAFNGEEIIVPRKGNKNVVIISEKEYNELQKAKKNAEYYEMLDNSRKQLEQGHTITLSMEDLTAMESNDWQPTQKIKEFMEQKKNE